MQGNAQRTLGLIAAGFTICSAGIPESASAQFIEATRSGIATAGLRGFVAFVPLGH